MTLAPGCAAVPILPPTSPVRGLFLIRAVSTRPPTTRAPSVSTSSSSCCHPRRRPTAISRLPGPTRTSTDGPAPETNAGDADRAQSLDQRRESPASPAADSPDGAGPRWRRAAGSDPGSAPRPCSAARPRVEGGIAMRHRRRAAARARSACDSGADGMNAWALMLCVDVESGRADLRHRSPRRS